jgi:hypothetical protein
MRKTFGLALLAVIVLSAVSVSPSTVTAEDERPDWGGTFSTWETSEEGDWVEYGMMVGTDMFTSRFEVLEKLEGGRVKYQHTTRNAAGDPTLDRDYTRPYARLPRIARLPFGIAVEWRTDTFKLGDIKIKCDVAYWDDMGDNVPGELWFSSQVPCGGVVKAVSAGVTSVALRGAFSESLGEVEGEDAPAGPDLPDVLPDLPEFFLTPGNYKVLKISRTGGDDIHQRREVTAVTADSSILAASLSNAEGVTQGNMPAQESTQTAADWKKTYGEPEKRGVEIEVAAGKFVCDYFKHEDGEEWINKDGATVKRIVKRGPMTITLELVKLHVQEVERKEEADADADADE